MKMKLKYFPKINLFFFNTNEENSTKSLPEKALCSVINMETDNSYQTDVCINEFTNSLSHRKTPEKLKNKISINQKESFYENKIFMTTNSYEDTLVAQIPKLNLDDLSKDFLFDENKSIIDYPLNRPDLPVNALLPRKQSEQLESNQIGMQNESCPDPPVIVSSQTSHTSSNLSVNSVNIKADKVVNLSVNQSQLFKQLKKSSRSQKRRRPISSYLFDESTKPKTRNQSDLIEKQLCELDKKKYEVIEPMLCMPTEMWLHIFSYLSLVDLCHVSQTCSRFFNIATDRTLWRCVSIENKRLSNNLLELLGKRQPVELRFFNCDSTKVTNIGMRKLFRGCKNSLKKLTITDCKGNVFKGDNIFLYVSCHCPNIRSLSVPWSSLGNDGLTALVSASACLKEICLNGNSSINDQSFSRLVDLHFLYLTCVEIEGCFNISSQAILGLTKQAKNLTKFNIGLCSKVTHNYCLQICSQLQNLNYLDVHGITAINDCCLKIIAEKCSELQTLIIGNCFEVTDLGINYIASHLCKIEHLDVSNCSKVSDESVMKLKSTNLSYLDLSSTSVSSSTVDWLSQSSFFKSINFLKLSYCRNITFISLLKMVQSCSNLQNLHLYGVRHVKVSNLQKINSSLIVEK